MSHASESFVAILLENTGVQLMHFLKLLHYINGLLKEKNLTAFYLGVDVTFLVTFPTAKR